MTHGNAVSASPDSGGGKEIGLVSALAFSVGTMIGGGVFALFGTVLDASGSNAIAAYVLAGVIMLFSAPETVMVVFKVSVLIIMMVFGLIAFARIASSQCRERCTDPARSSHPQQCCSRPAPASTS